MSIMRRILSTALPIMLVAIGLVAIVYWALHSGQFPLRVIDIKSELKHVSEQEIQTVVTPHLAKGFFGLEVGAVQKSLKQLPWIEVVEVRRVWPDQLAVLVKEKTAQARWGDEGILSTDGTIFYPVSVNISEKLPKFVGPAGRSLEMLQQYLTVLELLGPTGLTVKALELSPAGAWQIVLDNGIAIILGKTGLNERTVRFVQAYHGNLRAQIERIAYIDLRYTNGFAIGWKAGVQTGVQ